MNRKLIFVGLLLGLFIFPLFLNIHKVNADDKAPVMLDEGCTSGTDTQRITCYKNNDLAYRERILELERGISELQTTRMEVSQGQQQGIQEERVAHEENENLKIQLKDANDQIKELSGQFEESGRTLTATESALDKALAEVAQNFSQLQEANDQLKELSGQFEESGSDPTPEK